MSRPVLKLYVVGGTQASERALRGVGALGDDIDLEIVDVREQPQVAEEKRILATPLLVRESPLPVRRVAGDLSDAERVAWTLGLGRARG